MTTMILSSKHLILREFLLEDWQAIFDYQTDPQYLEFYEWETRSQTEVQEFVKMFLEQQKQVPRTKFQLAIVLKSEEKVIGNCGIRKITSELPEASLGYEIASGYWGKGYATEAASTMIKFGFEELKLERIYGWCIAENLASARVMEKVGMRFEERFTENEWFKGRWWDTLIFGISRDEWERTA